MIDPYLFVRVVTLTLATTWTVLGLLRSVRFIRGWELRLAPLGLPPHWLRRQVALTLLRATVLDPLNLALMAILVAIWTAGSLR